MPNESPLLLLIDGHSMVFRAWFAIKQELATSDGVPTRGARGFISMLFKTIKDHNPSHIAVTFDTKAPTFRDEMYAEYKAGRPPIDPDLHLQIPIAKKILAALKIPVYELDGYEADDLVGTISRNATDAGARTIILTGDADQFQLVTDQTKLLMYSGSSGNKMYGIDEVKAKYDGLGPEYVPQIKALAGDKSDNIPGIPGVGDKSALTLLNHYKGLDQIYADLESVQNLEKLRGAKRVMTLLSEHRDSAYKSLELATIVYDAPINFDLKDALFGDYDIAEAKEAFLEYEFRTFAVEIGSLPHNSASQGEMLPDEPENYAPAYRIVDNQQILQELIGELRAAGAFAFDVETNSTDPFAAELVGISFATKADEGWYVPVGHNEGQQLDIDWVLEQLRDVMEDSTIPKYAHNANFDMSVFKAAGIEARGVEFDTMIAAFLCGRRQIGLKYLTLDILKQQMTPITDLIGSGKAQTTMDTVAIDKAAPYAAADATATWELHRHFVPRVREYNQERVFYNIEMALLPAVVKMQENGFLINAEYLKRMSYELEIEIDTVEQAINSMLGDRKFNINSNKQLGEILFDEWKAPRTRRTKTGWSVDESSLSELITREGLDDRVYELVSGVLKYRELAKLKSTYVDALPKLVNPRTGRVHTTFNQIGSGTGRFASANPNIQNIPIRRESGKRVRSAFITDTDKGWRLLSADYSQIELRVLAHLSNESELVKAFLTGEDIHNSTARAMYETDEVTPDQRRIAKILNFGVIYGLGPYGVARQTNLTRDQGRQFIELYFGKYPGIRQFIDEIKALARERGYAETVSGRRLYLPALQQAKGAAFAGAERVAVNMPIQGTAADIIKLAMIKVHSELRDQKFQSRMLAQVHDELVFEVAPDEMDRLKTLVTDSMCSAMELNVPLIVDLKLGDNWGQMEPL